MFQITNTIKHTVLNTREGKYLVKGEQGSPLGKAGSFHYYMPQNTMTYKTYGCLSINMENIGLKKQMNPKVPYLYLQRTSSLWVTLEQS